MSVANTAFFLRLRAVSPKYAAKLDELRDSIAEWLSYVPHTFPHYTRHTIGHSEEIITQLSFLLFRDADPNHPSVSLSGAEMYILGAAAYLHDAGMVASDIKKRRQTFSR